MKVILHIGTHKTGTSALQSFCATNRNVLLTHGVHYPLLPNRSRSFNFLAAHIAFGRTKQVRRFFARAIDAASRAGVQTLLVSAESFYAMTGLFYRLYDRPCGDYWEHERKCVTSLRECLPTGVDCDIHCYVRRQDRFLESLYNQCVKHSPGFGGEIAAFLTPMRDTLDYSRHVEIWEAAFGTGSVHVRCYEPAAHRLPDDFMESALSIGSAEGFVSAGQRVNERLSRDLLEYKRVLNRLGLSRADSVTAMMQILELSRMMGDGGGHHDYLSPEQRRQLLAECEDSNAALASRYAKVGRFLEEAAGSDTSAWEPYPGLSVEAALEIGYRHRQLASRPGERLRTISRRIYLPLRQRYAFVDAIAGSIRGLLHS